LTDTVCDNADSSQVPNTTNNFFYAIFFVSFSGGSFASKYAALHLPRIIMAQVTDLVQLSDSVGADTFTSTAAAADSSKCDVNAIAECLHRCFCQCDKEILTSAMTQHTIALAASTPSTTVVGRPRFASVGSCVSLVLLVKEVVFTAHCG
jgi:hypothetical protein